LIDSGEKRESKGEKKGEETSMWEKNQKKASCGKEVGEQLQGRIWAKQEFGLRKCVYSANGQEEGSCAAVRIEDERPG